MPIALPSGFCPFWVLARNFHHPFQRLCCHLSQPALSLKRANLWLASVRQGLDANNGSLNTSNQHPCWISFVFVTL